MTNYIGIDLGGMSAKGAVLDGNGVLHEIYTVPTHKENTPEQTVKALGDLVKRIADLQDVTGIGIGSPGIVDSKSGTVLCWENFGWKDVPLMELVEKETGLPTLILNDANAATLGEYTFGSAKKYNSAVMLTLGTGVGSGIVIDGKIFVGNKGAGGELGHEVIRFGGEKCACGRRGCLERYASASALARQAQKAMQKNPQSALWQLCGGTASALTGKAVFDAAKANDVAAVAVLCTYTDYVAAGIVNAVNAFRPEAVIIGGGISVQDELLIRPVQQKVQKIIGAYAPVEVVAASLGNQAGIYGAAKFAEVGELI